MRKKANLQEKVTAVLFAVEMKPLDLWRQNKTK